ncbi:hypothetical protein BGZ54_007277 [Gamsiella multidivaricata]|nr:hypothetical protein BGZ54_007277 [Gamsiella multidivaricata]
MACAHKACGTSLFLSTLIPSSSKEEMNPPALPTSLSLSLSNFPVGIGLIAAAHLDLCRRNLSWTAEETQLCVFHRTLARLENTAHVLSNLNTLTELTSLVNSFLMQFPEYQALGRRYERRRGPKPHRDSKDKRVVHTTKHSIKKEHNQNGSKANENVTKNAEGKDVATIPSDKEDASLEDHAVVAEDDGHAESSTAGSKRHRSMRHPRHPLETRFGRKKTILVETTAANLEQWSNTYKALRQSQEASMEELVSRVRKIDPHLMNLQNSSAFSFFLSGITILRYAITTERFMSFITKYTWPLLKLGSWFKWSSISPPRSSYIPWGLAPPSGGHLSEQSIESLASNAGTGANLPVAFAFLPLIPTLFISGIHLLASVKAQWVSYQIHSYYRQQAKYAKRLSVVITFMIIRERRLLWLAQKIRSFDEEREKALREQDFEDVEGTDNDDEGDGQNTTQASVDRIPREGNTVAGTALAGRVSCLDADQQAQGSQHEQSSEAKTIQLTFGPDLGSMDLRRFLNDSAERRKILRLEFEGMRDELLFFRESLLPSHL